LVGLCCAWLFFQVAKPFRVAVLTEEEAAIYEALFRYQMREEIADVEDGVGYFLEIQDKDPPAAFLAQFADSSPQVQRGSLCMPNSGIRFSAGRIERVDEKTVKVLAGHFLTIQRSITHMISPIRVGCLNRYTLSLKDGTWIVTTAENIWAS
jgi:hypothetical protein